MKKFLINKPKETFLFTLAFLLLIFFTHVFQYSVRAYLSRTYFLIIYYPLLVLIGILIYRKMTSKKMFFLFLFISFVFKFSFGYFMEVVPFSYADFHGYYGNTRSFLYREGGLFQVLGSRSPGTIFYYALIMHFFGDEFNGIYFINAILNTGSVLILYGICKQLQMSIVTRRLATIIFALSPVLNIFSSTIASEHLYVFFYLAATYFFVKEIIIQDKVTSLTQAVLIGLFLGFYQMTRSNGIILLLVYLSILSIKNLKIKSSMKIGERILPLFILVVSFFLVISPVIYKNWVLNNKISIYAHGSTAKILLIGTNQMTGGRWNRNDVRFYKKQPKEIRGEKAIERVKNRILVDPRGFFLFATTKKVQVMWGRESPILRQVIKRDKVINIFKWPRSRWRAVIDGYYGIIIGLSAFWFLTALFRKNDFTKFQVHILILSIPLALIQASHFFLEVMERYHLMFLPFISLVAAAGVSKGAHLLKRANIFNFILKSGNI